MGKKGLYLKILSKEKINFIVELWAHFAPNFKCSFYLKRYTVMNIYACSPHIKKKLILCNRSVAQRL